MKRAGQRLAERAPGGGDLGVRLLRRNLECEVEGRVLGQQRQQVVENGNPRVGGGPAGPVHRDPCLKPAFLARVTGLGHPSTEGIAVPNAHRFPLPAGVRAAERP